MNTFIAATAGGFAGALAFTLIELAVFKILQHRGLNLVYRATPPEEN